MTNLPDWLFNISYGLAEHRKIRLLIDGTRFSVVQIPGGRWSDNGGSHYGCTSYYLVDKQAKLRQSVGLLDCKILQEGGRAKLDAWRKICSS